MNTNKITQLKEFLIYLESWLDETALIERFNVPRERILSIYNSFIMAKLNKTEEEDLRLTGAILSQSPNKKRLFIGDTLTDRSTFSIIEPDIDQTKLSVWIIQFIGPIKSEWTTILETKGAQIYGYIQPYSVFAYMTLDLVNELKQQDFIEWIGRYCQKTKIHPNCGKDSIVHYFPWKNKDCVHECICSDTNNYEELAQSEGILCINPYIKPQLYNERVKIVMNTDIIHIQGIGGSNEIVTITDTGIYEAHESFFFVDSRVNEKGESKIVNIIDVAGDAKIKMGGDGDGHGTHVAGSVSVEAPDSKLVMVKIFDNDGNWAADDHEYDFWKKAYLVGSKINNNSWGSNSHGAYLSTDQDADKICIEYPDYVLLVANGNEGPGVSSVGSPGGAKNVISVGACVTDNPNNMANFSSRGPTNDKRIKPDVIAPGTSINSAQSQTNKGYVELKGTSMATPQVSGVVALIRQYFKEGKYSVISGSHNPSSALVKAMLINGAVEMTGSDTDRQKEKKFPNNSQGWGRVDSSRTLPFENSGREIKVWDIEKGPLTGDKWSSSFKIPVSIDAEEIKITIVWTDPPSMPNNALNLVNKFNLKVITPNNKVFLGNNFKGLNPSYSVQGGVFDNRNNVEGVHLIPASFGEKNVPTGEYILEVISAYTSSINVGFAIVVGIDKSIIINDNQKRIAIIGDYNNQIASFLRLEGFAVDSYVDYNLTINKYKGIILNKVSDNTGFNNLLISASKNNVGLIFLGSYQVIKHGLGVLSKRLKNPISVNNKWKNGPVKVQIIESHDIFKGYQVGSVVELINGGNDDYQSFDGFNGTIIGANPMNLGLPYMIGFEGKKVLLGSMGVSAYTNITHWTQDCKKIFLNTVNWI
jgi:hypothetical protein